MKWDLIKIIPKIHFDGKKRVMLVFIEIKYKIFLRTVHEKKKKNSRYTNPRS